ncbi:MAG: hypothetical protein ACQKBY_02775 [Verrucomicrobiales bacterium]
MNHSANAMNPTTYQDKRSPVKLILIVALILLLVAISAGAAYWWWSNRPIEPTVLSAAELAQVEEKIEAAQATPESPAYEPGQKTIVLTEHELNGLLNHNTQLGDQVKIELAEDAVHARIRADLDPEIPVVGGRTLKAKARFIVKTETGQPAIILDDLTVWGISLPNDWLANLKGQNLLATVSGESAENGFARGIKEIAIHQGEIRIELNE